MSKKKEPPAEKRNSASGSGNHTTGLYHRKGENTMFEFEIGTNDYTYNSETHKSERLVLTGRASGCIDDYLVRTIITEDNKNPLGETRWVKIGDTVVQLYRIQYIKVKAVRE